MNKATIVLAAIGLVLVGVAVTRTPGQQVVGNTTGACCLPTGGCLLLVSEAACTLQDGFYLGNGTVCLAGACPGYRPPTVVGVSAVEVSGTNNNWKIFRTWSDGQIDATFVSFLTNSSCEPGSPEWCGPVVIVPGSCLTDIDGNGDTGITDFLSLLGNWGPCP